MDKQHHHGRPAPVNAISGSVIPLPGQIRRQSTYARLLLILFFVLFFGDMLNIDMSLMPGLSVKNALLYSTFLVLLIETAVTRRHSLELMSVFVPFTLFVAYAAFMWIVALLVLDYPGYSPRASLFALKGGPVDDLIVLLVFFFAITQTQQALWVIRGMLWLIIIGNLITVVEGMEILNLGLIGAKTDGRVLGPLGNANQFAYFLTVFLPLTVALYWSESGLRKALAGLGVVVSILAFVMAVSRGGIVGLGAGCILGLFFLRRIIPVILIARFSLGILAITGFTIVIASQGEYLDLLIARFGTFSEGGHRASSGRTIFWTMLLTRMLEDPVSFLTGFGWDAYQTFQRQNIFGYAAHSTYLTILFNLGLVGLFFYLVTLANVLRNAVSATVVSLNKTRYFLVGFVFGFSGLVVALIFNDLSSPSIYIWGLVGLCMRLAVLELSGARGGEIGSRVHAGSDTRSLRGIAPNLLR